MPSGIISSREQRKQFDLAVRDVVKERKLQQQLQLAVQQGKKAQQQQQKKELQAVSGRRLARQSALPRWPRRPSTGALSAENASQDSPSLLRRPPFNNHDHPSSSLRSNDKDKEGRQHTTLPPSRSIDKDHAPPLSDKETRRRNQARRNACSTSAVSSSFTSTSSHEHALADAILSIDESKPLSHPPLSSGGEKPEFEMPNWLRGSPDRDHHQKKPPQDGGGNHTGDWLPTKSLAPTTIRDEERRPRRRRSQRGALVQSFSAADSRGTGSNVDGGAESLIGRLDDVRGDGGDGSDGADNSSRPLIRKVSDKWANLAGAPLIIPPYQPKEEQKEGPKEEPNEGGMKHDEQMDTEELLDAALSALHHLDVTPLSPGISREDGDRLNSITSHEDFKLEDLVPSRRSSLVRNSSKNMGEMEAVYEEGHDQSKSNRNGNVSKSQMCEATARDREGHGKADDMEPYNSDNLKPTWASGNDAVPFGEEQQQQEVVQEEDLLVSQGVPSSHHVDDPRSQFVFMKGQAKSNSGGTGKTQGTSGSSLFSSRGSSIGEIHPTNNSADNPPPSKAATAVDFVVNHAGHSFGAIKEEEKDLNTSGECINEKQREIPPVEVPKPVRSFSGNVNIELDEDVPGVNTHRRRQSGRMKMIRMSIQKSLKGSSSRGGDTRSNGGEVGGGGERRGHLTNDGGSGSIISADQQEAVARHLHRKSSTRSITSAFSSVSAMARTSDNESRASNASSRGSLMNRFRLKSARPRMPKARSDRPSRRNANSNNQQYTTPSNVSDISMDDGSHRSLNTNGTSSSQFTEFYENSDHVRAVSSLASSMRITSRSLVSPLATVNEPPGGEAKHDEDYHSQRDMLDTSNSVTTDPSAYQRMLMNESILDDSMTFYRHPSHEHPLVHLRPIQLFPDSPGWQCDLCGKETVDTDNVKAYVSTGKNYVMCESCMHTVTKF